MSEPGSHQGWKLDPEPDLDSDLDPEPDPDLDPEPEPVHKPWLSERLTLAASIFVLNWLSRVSLSLIRFTNSCSVLATSFCPHKSRCDWLTARGGGLWLAAVLSPV